MYGRGNMTMMRGFRMDPAITKQKLKPGTVRRIAAYARPYRWYLAVFLLMTGIDALITVVNPLLLRVGPPRPRNVTPVSVRIRWTKPYDLPVEAARERMLSPLSYLFPRSVASLLRSTPVTRVPFLRAVSATCTSVC